MTSERYRRTPEWKKRAIITLFQQGDLSVPDIARRLEIAPPTVRRHLRRVGLTPPSQAQIDPAVVARAIELVRQGYSYRRAGQETGLATGTVRKYTEQSGNRTRFTHDTTNEQYSRANDLVLAGMMVREAAAIHGINRTSLSAWRMNHGFPPVRSPGRPPRDALGTAISRELANGPLPVHELYRRVADTITPGTAMRAVEDARRRSHWKAGTGKGAPARRTRERSTEQLVESGKKFLFRRRIERGNMDRWDAPDGTPMVAKRVKAQSVPVTGDTDSDCQIDRSAST